MILHVPIKPMAYKRARASGKGVYVPKEYQEWKGEAGMLMRNAMKLRGMPTMSDAVQFTAHIAEDHLDVWVQPQRTQRPKLRGDLDNYIKAILDAGNGVLYEDDRQVEWINGGFV